MLEDSRLTCSIVIMVLCPSLSIIYIGKLGAANSRMLFIITVVNNRTIEPAYATCTKGLTIACNCHTEKQLVRCH